MNPASDNTDLASFGYRQELKRAVFNFSSFAASLSYVYILIGAFSDVSFGLWNCWQVFLGFADDDR